MTELNKDRRHFIGQLTLMAGGLIFAPEVLIARSKQHRYKVAVIDLMILKRQKLSALPLAKEIGADGLELDMGGLGNRETFDSKLADPALEDSPISQYSYPSVIQTVDGMLHFIYTWRRQKIKHVIVDPSKLKLKAIKNGVWPSIKGYTAPIIKESKDEEPN